MNTNINITGSIQDVGNIINQNTHNYTRWIIIVIGLLFAGIIYLIFHYITKKSNEKIKKDIIDYHSKIADGYQKTVDGNQKIILTQHSTINKFISKK